MIKFFQKAKKSRYAYQTINGIRRYLLIPIIALSALVGLGPFLDGGYYEKERFHTFSDVAPLELWGILFLFMGALALYALITRDVRFYIASQTLSVFLSSFWTLTLLRSRLGSGIPVSLAHFGIWIFPLAYSVIILIVPISVREDSEKE